jgi:fumarate reductase subunit D
MELRAFRVAAAVDRRLPNVLRYLHSRSSTVQAGASPMIYILAVLLPPLGLLLNGQPFSALLNLVLIVPCLVFGLVFHVLLLVPSLHAVIAVHMKREDRKHREMVEAIERHGPPPGWKP